jgi:tetratricopeptide (TPR) repeat protein
LKRAPYFFPAMFNLGRAYVQSGQTAQAIEIFGKALQLSRNRTGLPALAHAYAVAGRTSEAQAVLKDLLETPGDRYIASPLIAQVYMGLGEMDSCFEWLHKGIEERAFWCVFMQVDPIYDAIRNDPRFQKALQLVGFSPKRIAAPLQMPSPLPKKERARASIAGS